MFICQSVCQHIAFFFLRYVKCYYTNKCLQYYTTSNSKSLRKLYVKPHQENAEFASKTEIPSLFSIAKKYRSEILKIGIELDIIQIWTLVEVDI